MNVLDITPNVENGLFPARVELGEAFNVTAQVFIEGRTKAGATVSVRNARGREVERFAMTCTNPGLDRWEAMVKIGEHSDLKPWDADYAAVKRQLGEWQIVVEGWEDTYQSWLHDAAIKVKVMTTWRMRWNPAHSCWHVGPTRRIPSFPQPTRRCCATPPRPWKTRR